MTVVGITGPIGSGKSEVISYLMSKGYMCLIEDDIAAAIRESDEVKTKISLYFNGKTDKASLRAEIKKDPSKLLILNGIIHPLVYDYVVSAINDSEDDIVFIESAIPREARFNELCDRIWYVDSDYDIRLKRAVSNRGISRQDFDVLNIKQSFEEINITDIIKNNKEIEDLHKKVDELINGILQYSQRKQR